MATYSVTSRKFFAMISNMLKYGEECATHGDFASGSWAYFQKGVRTPDGNQYQWYQDASSPYPWSAKAGYQQVNLTDFAQMSDTIPYRYGIAETVANQPKTSSTGSLVADGGATYVFKYMYLPTRLTSTLVNAYVSQTLRTGQLGTQFGEDNRRRDIPERRYVYLNDLMNHKQPFGPTRRVK